MTTKKRINHFVFLNPGERLFVCTDRVAGEDYAQLVEVVFPTYQDEGTHFDPKRGCHQELVAAFDDNALLNLCTGVDDNGEPYPADDFQSGIARALTEDGEEAWVAAPLSLV
jgi:hypothetical protein